MREIKFRAWCAWESEMVNFPNIYIELEDGCMSVFKFVPNAFGLSDRIEMDTTDGGVKLMQYTGLKDKNGVEIYEGDVVEWNRIKYEVRIGEFGVRDFETESVTDFSYGVYGDPINETVEPFCHQLQLNNTWIRYHGIEVIGNIYEHPQLLTRGESDVK